MSSIEKNEGNLSGIRMTPHPPKCLWLDPFIPSNVCLLDRLGVGVHPGTGLQTIAISHRYISFDTYALYKFVTHTINGLTALELYKTTSY